MARMTVRWLGRAFDRRLFRHLNDHLGRAARHLEFAIQKNISTPGYKVVRAGGRNRRVIDVARSRPGQFPFEQTGDLIRSFDWAQDRRILRSYVFSRSKYMKALEFGLPAKNLRPRPHVRRTFRAEAANLGRIILTPL